MQDVGKEKILCVHFLHVYPEAEDLGSSHVSLSHGPKSVWLAARLRGTGQRAREFTHGKWGSDHVGGSAVF